jgi:hypothetical protein
MDKATYIFFFNLLNLFTGLAYAPCHFILKEKIKSEAA